MRAISASNRNGDAMSSHFPCRFLPTDSHAALLVGRILTADGPAVVVAFEGGLYDVTASTPTVADLMRGWNGAPPAGQFLGKLDDFDFDRRPLLAPVDLQVLKAAGVTFAVSAIEQVIEERARG